MPMSTKRKAPGKVAAPVVKPSAQPSTTYAINTSKASVAGPADVVQNVPQHETISISSDADSDEDMSDDNEEADANANVDDGAKSASTGLANGKTLRKSSSAEDEAEAAGSDDEEPTSPSFGELLRGSEAIDVSSLLQQAPANSASLSRPATIVPPTHQSLTTVLTQALRTDDIDLLESCLHTKDIETIKNTIERIDSILAGTLLDKLAARLYRRPGRAGVLMTWIQWTLVAHGGTIASQPKVIQGLASLQKVLEERAKGLGSLLSLKGKLDMLESQMALRRRMQRLPGPHQKGDDSDEEDVIWVEGETNGDAAASRRRRIADDSDDDAMITNGVLGDSDDSDDDEEEVEEEEEESDMDALDDDDDVDHEEIDDSMAEDDESDAEAAPPAKIQKVSRAPPKKR
ncbi:Dip2/Utp12 family-domain-containing protein [Stachybotrys elegans]|uniref:Dip2/Utp12 family-domain-containing protein n=1 Tax=Stachybotrys elegans TaxID=80388 RepID=A0A8K0WQZ8_9HYPO|nr:Dip2/Utp12 family-domain-containing protein [Stachybotrys elegans]